MAYIVIVTSAILSTPGTGMPFSGVLTATVLVASSMTLAMSLYARLFAATSRARDVPPMLWALAMLSAGLLVLEH